MSSFDDLRSDVLESHDNPMHRWHVNNAFASIKEGLQKLAELGHRFDLVEAEPQKFPEWPKMFYHGDGRQLVLHSPSAAAELGPGWSDKQPGQIEVKPQPEVKSESEPKAKAVALELGADGADGVVVQSSSVTE